MAWRFPWLRSRQVQRILPCSSWSPPTRATETEAVGALPQVSVAQPVEGTQDCAIGHVRQHDGKRSSVAIVKGQHV